MAIRAPARHVPPCISRDGIPPAPVPRPSPPPQPLCRRASGSILTVRKGRRRDGEVRSILVPVVDDPASLQAVAVAASLARQEKAVLTLLHVIKVERSLPVTADMDIEAQRGEDLLRRARALAAREAGNITIEDDLLQAREAGAAIVEEASARGADAVMMGVGWSPLLGQFEVGPTASYVLGHAACHVWVVRDRIELAVPAPGKAPVGR